MFALRGLTKRALHDRFVLAATALTVLCALVLVASGPIYARGVSTATLRRQLEDLDPDVTAARAGVRAPVAQLAALDELAQPVLDRLVHDVGGEVIVEASTDSFSLPGDDNRLTTLRWMPALVDRAQLQSGRWPVADGAPTEVVAVSGAAAALRVEVGDRFVLGGQRGLVDTEVVLVGLIAFDPGDPLLAGDDLLRDGMVEGVSFTDVGPMLTPNSGALPDDAFVDIEWWVRPTLSAIDDADVEPLQRQAESLERDLDVALRRGLGSEYATLSALAVTTGLDEALRSSGRSLTVTRANVAAVLVQISLLAGFAIALTAELVAGTRTDETILAHARGVGRRSIVLSAALEAVAIVVPLAVISPWVAASLLESLEVVGPVASIDLQLELSPNRDAWLSVSLAAVAAVAFLTWPAASVVASNLEEGRRNRRSVARARFQRAGVDVALVVIALLSIWQLQELGSRRTERPDGTFGVDPLLVVAPAVATLAGAVLALRFIPLVARAGEAVAARGRSAVAALTAWQVARRPRRHTRSALLLVLAVAIGFFAATYAATWRQSQEDQARQQTGAEVRVLPDRRVGEAIPDLNLVARTQARPDVAAVMGVERRPARLPAASLPGQLVLVDAAAAADVATVIGVPAAELERLMAALAEHRPEPTGIVIDGPVDAIGVDVRVSQPLPPEEGEADQAEVAPPRFDGRLDLVVVDGAGALHRLHGPALAADGADGAAARVIFDLAGSGNLPVQLPLTVIDLEIRSVMPTRPAELVHFSIDGLQVRDSGAWRTVAFDASDGSWRLDRTGSPTLARQPAITHVGNDPEGVLSFDLELGIANQRTLATFSAQSTGPRRPDTVPVIVTDAWLESAVAEVGDSFPLDDVLASDGRATVVGSVPLIPTVDPMSAVGAMVDRSTLQLATHSVGRPIGDLSELWISLQPATDPASVETALRGEPFRAVEVVSQEGLEDDLSTDPIALGTAGALAVGFGAASVVTAIGFAVSGGVSARERATEFALLRALGLSSRQLGRWLAAEQALTVVVSIALGTLVGWLLSTAVLPLTSLTQEGAPVVPDARVVYPWRSIVLLDGILVAVLVLIVAVMTVALRRIGVGERLRSGDGR